MARQSSVRAPRSLLPVLTRIIALDDEPTKQLADQLSTADVRNLPGLAKTVEGVLSGVWDEDETSAFVTHLVSLATLAASENYTGADLAEQIFDQFAEELAGLTDRADLLPPRLGGFLSAPKLTAFAKAFDIAQESDRLVHSSRIITDIRPVFGDEPIGEPFGAVVIHTLRLEYFEDGEVRTLSFSLNSNDVSDLVAVAKRAEAKEKMLSTLLDRVKLTEFDLLRGETDDSSH